MSWIVAFVGFAALVILHEAGHFAAAKAVGMRVERFSLFFPPLIAKFRRKGSETEYAIGALPLGGYVKITGMNPHEELDDDVAHRAYYRQKVWKRIVVIVAGPAVNIVLAFLILAVLFGVRGLAFSEPSVDSVQPGTPAAAALQPGDRILSVGDQQGFEAGLSGEEGFERVEALREALVTEACGGVEAARCSSPDAVGLVVLRDGARETLQLTPRFDEAARRPLLGFAFGAREVDLNAIEASGRSAEFMWEVTTLTVTAIVRLFYNSQARSEVSGIVGGYEATRQAVEFDIVRAVQILALISLSLGIINLFPFLPLDGGHIFWAVAEKLRGRAISFAVMERASVVGILLVAFLFIVGLNNDLGRIFSGEGFEVR
jgi:regulator of sigma E protease